MQQLARKGWDIKYLINSLIFSSHIRLADAVSETSKSSVVFTSLLEPWNSIEKQDICVTSAISTFDH